MRQNHGAADLLVSVLGVDAQTERYVDGAVEFRDNGLLHQFHSLFRGIELVGVDQLGSVDVLFTMLAHVMIPPCGIDGLRLPHNSGFHRRPPMAGSAP